MIATASGTTEDKTVKQKSWSMSGCSGTTDGVCQLCGATRMTSSHTRRISPVVERLSAAGGDKILPHWHPAEESLDSVEVAESPK